MMFRSPLLVALWFSILAPVTARSQSCAAADAVLGVTKKHDQMKEHYDKFADTTSSETKAQFFAFLGQQEDIWLSFVVKHGGQAQGPVTTAMHLKGSHNVGPGQAVQSPEIFPDSTAAIVLADSARMPLRGGGHRVQRQEFNIIGPPSVDEELWFPISLAQLAVLAGAHSGGIRIGGFDMPMQNKIIESAGLAYRTAVCSSTLAAVGETK